MRLIVTDIFGRCDIVSSYREKIFGSVQSVKGDQPAAT